MTCYSILIIGYFLYFSKKKELIFFLSLSILFSSTIRLNPTSPDSLHSLLHCISSNNDIVINRRSFFNYVWLINIFRKKKLFLSVYESSLYACRVGVSVLFQKHMKNVNRINLYIDINDFHRTTQKHI